MFCNKVSPICHENITEDQKTNLHRRTSQLYEKKREIEEDDRTARWLRPYASLLVRYPSVVFTLTLVIFTASAILSVVKSTGAKDIPDFEPTKGNEARGTVMSSRAYSVKNLKKAYNVGQLVPANRLVERRKRSVSNLSFQFNPLKYYTNDFLIVFESVEKNRNLFNDMKSVCKWYKEKIIQSPLYSAYMQDTPVHHLPNYIALLNNRDDCENIITSDVENFVALLSTCVGYYKNESFLNCKEMLVECSSISTICKYHKYVPNAQEMSTMIYNVFHFLADISLMNDPKFLKSTMSFDFISNKSSALQTQFFQPLYKKELEDLSESVYGNIKIVAFHMFNFKVHIAQKEIILQSLFAAAAIVLVVILMWLYTGSIFIGLMTFSCIIIAMIIAYFVYTRIFDMIFSPFLNILTLIFIIGIGADDAFVYTGIWEESKRIYKIRHAYEHIEYLIKWTIHSIRHATIAMLVTSLTTAAAFYANMISSVTSVKCFGLYVGTTILINYLLMMTFFPCAVILHDIYFSKCMHFLCPCACKRRPVVLEADDKNVGISDSGMEINVNINKITNIFQRCQAILESMSYELFNKFLPALICKFRFLFIVIFLVLGIGGIVVTFGKPGLNPPSTSEFQMFRSSSSLEQYSLFLKKTYAFGLGEYSKEYSINFVFGVNAIDNGNKFDPNDEGKLVLKKELDIASVQVWLRNFCNNLITAFFYIRSRSCLLIDQFFTSLTQRCHGEEVNDKCCEKSLPMQKYEFLKCFKEKLKKNAKMYNSIHQPLFDQEGNLRSLVLQVTTNFSYSSDFYYNRRILESLETWTTNQMKNVTSDSFNGWWNGRFDFYDLQNSLFNETMVSLGIACAVAFAMILVTSLNLLLSIYSILTIIIIISVTVGVLVLVGWELNIVESIVFSVATGLSADFTLHYSVAYRRCFIKTDREVRVKYALSHIGPAVLMGAVTTFIAGLVMMPSTVRFYVQIGEFLMVIMFFSWLFSTFFFLPLCATIGPTGNLVELNCRKKRVTDIVTEIDVADSSLAVVENT